jgi:hypothetical protein
MLSFRKPRIDQRREYLARLIDGQDHVFVVQAVALFEPFLPGFLCAFVGFVELRPGCLPGQPGLRHQSSDVSFAAFNVEFFGEIVTREWNRPRGRVISDFLW